MSRSPRTVDVLLVGSLAGGAFATILRALGHRCIEAKDANAALASVVNAPVSAVLLPLDVDGLETRELIARLRLGRPGVGVALAAKPHEAGRIVSAWVHGFDGFVIEPPDERQLREALDRVIEIAHARMETSGDTPLAQKLEDTKRALEEERDRVAKLRARVKKLEGSISGLSSEVRHVVKARTQPQIAVSAGSPARPAAEDDAKTSIYDDGASIRSGDPARAAANHRERVPVEARMHASDIARSRIYNDDDDWSESSTAAAPIYATVEDDEANDPAFRAPVQVDPFLDDVHDVTDPVDVNAKKPVSAMKIGELREELSDLLRPPGRQHLREKSEPTSSGARPRALPYKRPSSTDRPSGSAPSSKSSSGKVPRARR